MNYNKPEPSFHDGNDALRRSRHRKTGENGSRRWLFLAADVLLLIAIVAAIFFLVVLLTPLDLFGGEDTEQRRVVYTVEFAGVDSALVESLQVGDTVTDAATGSAVGVVTDVLPRSYEVYTDIPTSEPDDELNSYVVTKNTYPDTFSTVTVTIRVLADYVPEVGYTAENCRIAVGRQYELHFPGYAGSGVCVTFAEEE